MNEEQLDQKIRDLNEKEKLIYAEHLFGEVGGYDGYYDGINFVEAAKMCFATFEQKSNAYSKTVK